MLIPIDSLDDHRVALYRNLRDRELAREGDRFLIEGQTLVRRLLEGPLPAESVLVGEDQLDYIRDVLPEGLPVYVANKRRMYEILGYRFHRGSLAIARRPQPPSLDEVGQTLTKSSTLLLCPQLVDAENMGAICRIAAAFGVSALLLGPACCDPYWRRAVRVSMGAVFELPILRCADMLADAKKLIENYEVELAGAIASDRALPLAGCERRGRPLGICLGHEHHGIPAELEAICHRAIAIPMHLGADSLNVAVAGAVFLYHFTQAAEFKAPVRFRAE